MPPAELLRRLRFPGYGVAVLLIVLPLAEAVVGAWPPHPNDPFWRITAATLTIGAAVPMLLVLFLVLAIGTVMRDQPAVWLVAILCALATLCCIVGAGFFALDMLEVKTQVKPSMESRFALSSTWSLVKIVVAAAGAVMLGVSAWRTARSMKQGTEQAKAVRKEPSMLVGSR
jgi:hypothetical protein